MAKKLVFFGSIKDGVIQLPKTMRQQMLETFNGSRITVTVQRKRKKRSTEQNAYYWGAVIPAILDGLIKLGNNMQADNPEHRNAVHEFLKNKFVHNGTTFVTAHGEVFEFPASTSELSTSDFMDYLQYVKDWAFENLGVRILDPGEQAEIEYT